MDKEQFDSNCGGSQILPHMAEIKKILVARSSEIEAMNNLLENPQQNKLIFQKLPRQMRRRIMSHNVKRMPRRLRESHLNQMKKSGLPIEKKKVPSRKYRRRPRNLLQEYNRRKRDKFWLETHIWHAKRFKMIEKWGYKLAEHPNDKCFKANYRAVTAHSLIQDISYYTCIEISGPLEILISCFQKHVDPNFNFQKEYSLEGEEEETMMFYKKGGFPNFPLGNISFMWKPGNSNHKTVWLWIHPGTYQEIFYELVSNFNFELKYSAELDEVSEKEDYIDAGKMPPAFKILKEVDIPVYINRKNCEMIILRNSLNRFRICGPLTHCVLTEALKLPKMKIFNEIEDVTTSKIKSRDDSKNRNKVDRVESNQEKMEVDQEKNVNNFWHEIFYAIPENLQAFKNQRCFLDNLKNLKSPAQIPANSIIALTVLDPRFFVPEKRTKSVHNTDKTTEIDLNDIKNTQNLISDLVNRSAIWESNVRNDIIKNCMATSQINKMRSEILVPGMENDGWFDEEKIQKIPILLIQKPGIQRTGGITKRRNGFASGFDIIIPSGWALPFWLSFIYRCVRPGGLRESRSITFETLNMSTLDVFHPGSPAYIRESLYKKNHLKESYFKRPPNRRVNYTKLGITSPFSCEWGILSNEWGLEGEFFALRNNSLLRNLDENLSQHRSSRKISLKPKISFSKVEPLIDELLAKKNYLIPVKVTVQRKGTVEDFAIICLPTEDDLDQFKRNRKWTGPIESHKSDTNEKERINSRKKHLELLKRLRKQRVRRKKKLENSEQENESADLVGDGILDLKKLVMEKLMETNKKLIENQAWHMEKLSLPECTRVRFSCDREIMGFVEQGGFCFSEAGEIGRGYVVLEALKTLISRKLDIVLIRNTQSRQYRLANLEILVT